MTSFLTDGVGQESNPLQQSISFATWALSMPRWVLRVRTKFSWFLIRSFNAGWQGCSLPTAGLPLTQVVLAIVEPLVFQRRSCFGLPGSGSFI